MTLKDELPGSVGAQYGTGEEWRNNYRENEEMEPKQKQHPAVDVTGNRSKVRCWKEQQIAINMQKKEKAWNLNVRQQICQNLNNSFGEESRNDQ